MSRCLEPFGIIRTWLKCCCLIVLLIIWWGGVTRLTRSGLSITEWNLTTGILPPMSTGGWIEEKFKYEQSPEYKLINKGMLMEDFKKIYLIEYFHRLLAKIAFFSFLLPYTLFSFTKYIGTRKDHFFCLSIITGVMIQGLIGWFMVKSGLKNSPEVGHYWLSFHLCSALILFLALWYPLSKALGNFFKSRSKKIIIAIICLTICQVALGGMTSGLRAGFIYNTFPLMNGYLLPPEILYSLDDPITVQLLHRITGIIILTFSISLVVYERNIYSIILAVITLIQAFLGIMTLTLAVPIEIASIHQITGFLLVGYQMSLLKTRSKSSLPC